MISLYVDRSQSAAVSLSVPPDGVLICIANDVFAAAIVDDPACVALWWCRANTVFGV